MKRAGLGAPPGRAMMMVARRRDVDSSDSSGGSMSFQSVTVQCCI